jgi:hypothetical protein
MAAPTSIVVTVDDTEYSRFEADRSVVTALITPAGTLLDAEEITVELVKARRNRDVVVATKTLTLTQDDPKEYSLGFDLNKIVDNEEVPKVRRGDYLVRATSVTDTNITDDSEDFLVSLLTVERLKADYLHGTDQRASEVFDVTEQPQLVTGVEVVEVSRGTPQTWIPLSYAYGDDGEGNVTRHLSWCGGPVQVVTSGKKRYTLRRDGASDYIKVKVSSVSSMPTRSISEDLLVERKPMSEERIRGILDQAISWIEDVALSVYLEPTKVTTQPDASLISYPVGTDIPVFSDADWDCVVDAVTFRRAAAGRWINFKLPYWPLIRFDQLYGQIANTRIVDIALEWVEAHEKGGFVELVPFNQEIAFNFIGLIWVEALRGPVPLPNFWNFDALVGYRKTPEVLLELIAKKAAIDILTIAGQAFRGGFSSQSVSRDGISESVSYTASATYGIYSATIEDYRKWIDENLDKLKGAFRGANMVVL